MHQQIRRLEHRAEQLAIRFEELADQPDTTRIALTGIFAALGLCWFAIAWGEGLLLLALPVIVAVCMILVKIRRPHYDPSVLADNDRNLGTERAEIDAWLTRVTTQPLLDPDESRAPFTAPAPFFEPPLLPPPRPREERQQTEQLGMESAALPLDALEEAQGDPATVALYEVSEIRADTRILLEVSSTFDGAVDVAFELIQERDPPELDIVLVRGDERETAWAYSRDSAVDQPRGTLELFGFDATRWAARR